MGGTFPLDSLIFNYFPTWFYISPVCLISVWVTLYCKCDHLYCAHILQSLLSVYIFIYTSIIICIIYIFYYLSICVFIYLSIYVLIHFVRNYSKRCSIYLSIYLLNGSTFILSGQSNIDYPLYLYSTNIHKIYVLFSFFMSPVNILWIL